MTNQIDRMKRVRILLESVPKEKVLKKKFIALFSLEYGISVRTIDNYLQTLIDAEKVIHENKMIWREL